MPGIGRYTAGAIASIALGQPAPIVEANTERLYARLLKLEKPLRDRDSQRLLWHFAQWQLEGPADAPKSSKKRDPGRINQAVMELGALVCKPVDPLCLVCPIVHLCPTAKDGLQQRIPPPKPKRQFTALHHVALIVRDRGRWLLRHNPPDGWWHGLWDFPRVDVTELALRTSAGRSSKSALSGALEDAAQTSILRLAHQQLFGDSTATVFTALQEPVVALSHGVTRYRIAVDGIAAQVDKRRLKSNPQWAWVDVQTANAMPLTAPAKKMLHKLSSQSSP